MKLKMCFVLVFLIGSQLLISSEVEGAGSDSSLKNVEISDMAFFNAGVQKMENKDWNVALQNFSSIREYYKDSQVFEDALYFQAVCNYHLGEYHTSNKMLTEYLSSKFKLKFFEDSLNYKLAIANKFRDGAKKHLFDSEKFPKWASAKEDALEIYEEIIEMVPSHDLAAHAYYEKGSLLKKMRDYKTALECFQSLIKMFPKNSLAPEGYISIGEIYFAQSHSEYRNSDLMDLAQLNLEKFTQNFPRDERIEKVKHYFEEMKEIHAKGLYDIGMFYERTHKPKASVIYYVTAIEKFPDAHSTSLCKTRLEHLESELNELKVNGELLK